MKLHLDCRDYLACLTNHALKNTKMEYRYIDSCVLRKPWIDTAITMNTMRMRAPMIMLKFNQPEERK